METGKGLSVAAWVTVVVVVVVGSVGFLPSSVHGATYNVGSLSCSATGQTSISITWSLPNNLAGDLTGYFIDVTRNDGLKTETYATQTITNPLTTSYSWSGLSIYGGYQVSVTCNSSVTPTQSATTTSCTTDEGVPLVGPSNVTAVATSYNQIAVTWLDMADISKQGVLQGFKLKYFRQIDSFPTEVALSASTFSHTLNSLSTGSMYIVSVLAYTSVGDGPQTSDTATTWGSLAGPASNETDNSTVYYCYQLIPGSIEFESAGREMSCVAYAAVMFIIGAFAAVLLLIVICLCCCGSGGGGGGGGGGGDTVIVIENPDPPAPCFSPVPESIATARDVGFDDMDNGWADPSGDRPKSRNAWGGDDGPKVPPVIVEEAEDGW